MSSQSTDGLGMSRPWPFQGLSNYNCAVLGFLQTVAIGRPQRQHRYMRRRPVALFASEVIITCNSALHNCREVTFTKTDP